MIYLIGRAPRAGKSILSQQFAAKLRIGWISTDLLMELLRVKNDAGIKSEWIAALEAITARDPFSSSVLFLSRPLTVSMRNAFRDALAWAAMLRAGCKSYGNRVY